MENNLINNHEGFRIISVALENFKNIEKKSVQINGKSLLICGKNGAGKSSLIQAIMSPMDTKTRPTEAIKKGTDKAEIVLVLGGNVEGNYEEYTLELYFTPAKESGRLVVKDMHGNVMKTPSTFVESLIGNVTFDIMAWINKGPAEKLKIIKELTGIAPQIDGVNLQIKNKKSEESMKKKRAEELEAILKNHIFSPEEIDKYSIPANLKPIQEEMTAVGESQATYDSVVNQMNGFENSLKNCYADIQKAQDDIAEHERKIAELRTKIDTIGGDITILNGNIETGKNWFSQNTRQSVEEVSKKMNIAIQHNEKHDQIKTLSNQQKEMITCKQDAISIKTEITALEDERSKMISGSQLPVQGLSFTEDTIILDGVPLDEKQINTARLLDVGIDVAIAMHPNLKTIFLKQGSLIDHENMEVILRKCEEKGYQIIVEMVDQEGGDLEVKFTESLYGKK